MEIEQVTYTGHVKNRARERGISEAEILNVIKKPDKRTWQRKGTHGGIVYKFENKTSYSSML